MCFINGIYHSLAKSNELGMFESDDGCVYLLIFKTFQRLIVQLEYVFRSFGVWITYSWTPQKYRATITTLCYFYKIEILFFSNHSSGLH